MSGHDPEEIQPIDWSNLEDQLQSSEQRADAIYWGEIGQQANDIKSILMRVLPEGVMSTLGQTEELKPTEPTIGADGKVVVTNLREAYDLSKEQPELAEVMAHTAYGETIVEQQQIEINMDKARSSGSPIEIKEVRTKKAELDRKIERLEFWAAVVTLHPINRDYDRENIPWQFGSGHSFLGQVRLCMRVEDEMIEAQNFVGDWSPRRIAARREQYEDLNRKDPDEHGHRRAQAWISDMEKRAEDKYVELNKYGKFLGAVVHGATHPDGAPIPIDSSAVNPSDKKTEKEEQPENTYVEMLRNMPGIDPVKAILDGSLKELPKEGWIIEAKVRPGEKGDIEIIRYTDGGFEATSHSGSFEAGEVTLRYTLHGDKYGNRTYSYRKAKEGKDESDHVTDVEPKLRGNVLASSKFPLRAHKGATYGYMTRSDPDREFYYGVKANRITDNPEQVKEIISQMASSMGMTYGETYGLIFDCELKDVFKPLTPEAPHERDHIEYAMMKNAEEVIHEYEDGGKLVDRGGDHIKIEADGSEWVAYSSRSDLYYSGPDDYIGMYSE